MSTTTLIVPEGFKALGAAQGMQLPSPEQLRILVLGLPKHGKTTPLMSVPEALVFNTEGKCTFVKDARATPLPKDRILDLATFEKAHKLLLSGEHPFKMVGVDGLAEWQEHCIVPLCNRQYGLKPPDRIENYGGREKERAGTGAGYNIKGQTTVDFLAAWHRAGLGWWVNAHLEREAPRFGEKRSEGSKRAKRPGIQDSTLRRLYRAADIICWAVAESDLVKVGDRWATKRQFTIQLAPKKSEDVDIGANVTLPASLVMPATCAWDMIRDAYLKGQK